MEREERGRFAWGDVLMWIAAVGVVALAAVRVVVVFSPQVYWAPGSSGEAGGAEISTELGPAAASVLDALAVLVLGIAVWVRARSFRPRNGGRVHWVLLTLWAVGFGFAAWQGRQDAESLRIGAAWMGALALGLAALHLGGDGRARRFMLAGFVAMAIPLAVQAVYQVAVEHPQTLRDYEMRKDEIARERGWTPGSSEQLMFERRMKQVEATGRIGFSNVFGTVTGALAMLALGVAAGPRKGWQRAGVVVIALAAVTALVLTFSRGAIAAMVVTGGAVGVLCVVEWLFARRGTPLPAGRWLWRLLPIGLIAAVVGGVAMVGSAGPPESAANVGGRLSLLFRWHYWTAATSMLAEQPVEGVGPGEFKSHYLVHKTPLNPEEVSDPHNVFVAYVSTLGVGGMAWSVVLLTLAWWAGARAAHAVGKAAALRSEAQASAPRNGRMLWSVLAAAVLVFGTEFILTLAPLGGAVVVLGAACVAGAALGGAMIAGRIKLQSRQGGEDDPRMNRIGGVVVILIALIAALALLPSLGLWLLSAVGFIAVAVWLSGIELLDGAMVRLGLFAAAVVLLVHSQIEMSLTNISSAPLLAAILGLAAAKPKGDEEPPGADQRRRIQLWITGILGFLAVGGAAAAFTYWILLWQAGLEFSEAGRRRGSDPKILFITAVELHDSSAAIEASRWSWEMSEHEAGRADEHRERAFRVLELSRTRGNHLATLWRAEAQLARHAATTTGNPLYLARALVAAEELLKHDPYGINSHVLAGDIAWEAQRPDLARTFYSRAIELSELAYLDPLKQLTDEQRRRIAERLQ